MGSKKPSEDDLCARVSQRIRAARIAAGLTPNDVIEASGVSRSTYYSYETGEGSFTISVLAKIAAAIGCTPSVLLITEEEEQRLLALNTMQGMAEQLAALLDCMKHQLAALAAQPGPSRSWAELIAAGNRPKSRLHNQGGSPPSEFSD